MYILFLLGPVNLKHRILAVFFPILNSLRVHCLGYTAVANAWNLAELAWQVFFS